MTKKPKKRNLVEIIRANPGCVAIVDNDCWSLYKKHPSEAPDDDDGYELWCEQNELVRDDQIEPLGDGGYGSGNCYGGDILQALAKIVGITVESV
jgi:hypothetical protein